MMRSHQLSYSARCYKKGDDLKCTGTKMENNIPIICGQLNRNPQNYQIVICWLPAKT